MIGGVRTSNVRRVRGSAGGAGGVGDAGDAGGVGTRQGRGLPIDESMTVTDNAIDYVYWHDPNELVDRLGLLVASRAAGHTGHDNEIASIVEELREVGRILN